MILESTKMLIKLGFMAKKTLGQWDGKMIILLKRCQLLILDQDKQVNKEFWLRVVKSLGLCKSDV